MNLSWRVVGFVCCIILINNRASEPLLAKNSDSEQEKKYVELDSKTYTSMRYGVSSYRNGRKEMQDYYVHRALQEKDSVFGVFDGHGGDGCFVGSFVSNFIIDYIATGKYTTPKRRSFCTRLLRGKSTPEDEVEIYYDLSSYKKRLEESFFLAHNALKEAYNKGSSAELRTRNTAGTTALVAIFQNQNLFIAWAGDTRAVLCSNEGVRFASTDHRIANEKEYKRLQGSHALLTSAGRVRSKFKKDDCGIEVTRAIGDFEYEDLLIPDPEFESLVINDKDEFLIMASDGIWCAITNEGAACTVRHFLEENPNDLSGAAKFLEVTAVHAGSADNIVVLIIDLKQYFEEQPSSS